MSLTTIVGALLAVVARPKAQEQGIEHLRRSHARLIDHIERLERELAMTQELLGHWRGEAARLARDNRDRRTYQMQQAQQRTFDQQSVYQGFCNCVPSRSQVWGAQHGLVQQLNDNMAHGAASRLNEEN